MPDIKLERIVSVSSEDEKCKAENLLLAAGSGKSWKTAKPGEGSATVIVQFTEACAVNSIHVGNGGSAFVEIFGGTEAGSDWQVMLVASTLMSPADARSSQNIQKVRLFNEDSLHKSSLGKRFDRIKVVCTQPFNKSVTYGLSFITFINKDASTKPDSSATSPYSLKPSSDFKEKTTLHKGSLFEERKRLQADQPPASAAAAVRALTRDADEKMKVDQAAAEREKSKPRPKPCTNKPLVPNTIASSKQSTDISTPGTKRPDDSSTPGTKRPADDTTSGNIKKVKRDEAGDKPRTDPSKVKPTTVRPDDTRRPRDTTGASSETRPNADNKVTLKEIMRGVTFVLSGYKNPKRSDLREKGIAMGARYKPDWDDSLCTHLICAYQDTPKFLQVNGKGYIVDEGWILDQHRKRARLSWRKYRLKRAKTPPPSKRLPSPSPPGDVTPPSHASDSDDDTTVKRDDKNYKRVKHVFDDSTDEDEPEEAPQKRLSPTLSLDSDKTEVDSIDTDDEIQAHFTGKIPNKGKAPVTGAAVVKRSLPDLSDYLKDKIFLLYGDVNNKNVVYRYINAYGGSVEDYMSEIVQYVISDQTWDDNFDNALNDNPNLIFVKSKWILDIHQQQKLLPYQKYAVTPN